MGLALANHLTTVLLVPLFLLLGALQPTDPQERPAGRWGGWFSYRFSLPGLGIQLLGLVLGASLYLTLLLRAQTHPEVNWGNPVTLDRLWWLVSGKLYQSYYLQFDFSHILPQVQAWAQFSVVQLGFFGIFLGLLGLVVFGKWSRLVILTAGVSQKPGETRIQLLERNAAVFGQVVPSVVAVLPSGLIHSIANQISHLANKISMLAASHVVVNTMDYAERSSFLHRYLQKIRAIFPPVELVTPSVADEQALQIKAGLEPGQRIIGMVARLAAENGVEYLVEAMFELLKNHPTARVLYVGQYQNVLGEESYIKKLQPMSMRWVIDGLFWAYCPLGNWLHFTGDVM